MLRRVKEEPLECENCLQQLLVSVNFLQNAAVQQIGLLRSQRGNLFKALGGGKVGWRGIFIIHPKCLQGVHINLFP